MIFRVCTYAFLAFVAGTFGFWIADRGTPAILVKAEVLEDVVRPGGILRVHYVVNRLRECSLKIDRILYDAQRSRIVLEDAGNSFSATPVGMDTYIVPIRIPTSFIQGPATYQTTARYECNPLQHWWPIIVIRPEIKFRVEGEPLPANQVTIVP